VDVVQISAVVGVTEKDNKIGEPSISNALRLWPEEITVQIRGRTPK
jgi:hypothetical protein